MKAVKLKETIKISWRNQKNILNKISKKIKKSVVKILKEKKKSKITLTSI